MAPDISDEEPDDDEAKKEISADEAFCTSCGEIIKEEAEVCPECGVRQEAEEDTGSGSLSEGRKIELQKLANKDKMTVMIVSFLLTPAGYLMVGKTGLALLNFFTFNYIFLGFFIVPFHTKKIIENAREDLERHGETW